MPAKDSPTMQTVAVIDIDATCVWPLPRLMPRAIQILEHLSQAVNLGKDTFTRGRIHRNTIEECVQVLKLSNLGEYGIHSPEDLRVIATSVRKPQPSSFSGSNLHRNRDRC